MDLFDVVTAIAAAVAVGFAVYVRIRISERRAALEASMILYESPVKNVMLAFCREDSTVATTLPLCPSPRESSIIHDVHSAIPYAWPEHVDAFERCQFVVWFVRSLDQLVNYGSRLRVAWKDVPALVGIPESTPGQGYGGMHFQGHVYVATYHAGRDPVAIYCHELAHFATRHHENDEVVAAAERALYAAVVK